MLKSSDIKIIIQIQLCLKSQRLAVDLALSHTPAEYFISAVALVRNSAEISRIGGVSFGLCGEVV